MDHDDCGGAGMPCACPIGRELEQRLDARRTPTASRDETLWTLTKAGSRARAIARTVAGVGIELRFMWNSELRQSQVYRDPAEAAAASSAKRKELVGRGWADVPPIMWGN